MSSTSNLLLAMRTELRVQSFYLGRAKDEQWKRPAELDLEVAKGREAIARLRAELDAADAMLLKYQGEAIMEYLNGPSK